MVNYLHDLSLITRNQERYASKQTIAASPEVTDLAQAARKPTS